MKKLIILTTFILIPFAAFGQKDKLDQIFNKYENTEGITSIKISKPMFQMLDNLKSHDEEIAKIKPLLSKINSIKILVLEKGNHLNGKLATSSTEKMGREIMGAVEGLNYEELMTVNSADNKIRFLASNAGTSTLDNLLLSITSKDEQLLMMLDGKISMADISALAEEANKY